ncbi:MAG: haloacid dehalogenase-like hydrolase, partial [Myxococcaceae bacterium]
MSTTSTPSAAPMTGELPVLVVGLERTLVRTDVVLEMAFAEVRRAPVALARMVGWALGGRMKLGHRLAAHFDPSALPYNEDIVDRLRVERAQGRRVVLASETEGTLADAVAAHLGVFDAVIAPRAAHPEAQESLSARLEREYPRHERLEPPADSSTSIARAAVKALRPHQWTKNLLVLVPAVLAHALGRGEVLGRGLLAFTAFSLC